MGNVLGHPKHQTSDVLSEPNKTSKVYLIDALENSVSTINTVPLHRQGQQIFWRSHRW